MRRTHDSNPVWPQWLNLLVPGAGLIAVGHIVAGLLVGVAFLLAANFAVVARWILPDEFPVLWQRMLFIAAALIYIVAQYLCHRALRMDSSERYAGERREALKQALADLQQNRPDEAFTTLAPLAAKSDGDLLILYRLAQAAAARGDIDAARRAWKRLRSADRHRVYARQSRAALTEIGEQQ